MKLNAQDNRQNNRRNIFYGNIKPAAHPFWRYHIYITPQTFCPVYPAYYQTLQQTYRNQPVRSHKSVYHIQPVNSASKSIEDASRKSCQWQNGNNFFSFPAELIHYAGSKGLYKWNRGRQPRNNQRQEEYHGYDFRQYRYLGYRFRKNNKGQPYPAADNLTYRHAFLSGKISKCGKHRKACKQGKSSID